MALIDKASLLFVPSVVAEGKAFNVLPSGNRAPDSTDQNSGYDQTRADFDFDRGSNTAATRVNADGLIEKYRENLLVQSNNFGTTWSAILGASVTSGQSGYDGSSDAWRLTKASGQSSRIYQNIALSPILHTTSIYAKADTLQYLAILEFSGSVVYFDLTNGTIGTTSGSPIDVKIEAVGATGWYRCSITDDNAITQLRIYATDTDGSISGSGSIFIQDAQVENSLVATDYLESTSVTGKAGVLVDLPRINYDANGENGSLLLEPSRQNKFLFSEYYGSGALSIYATGTNTYSVTNNYSISPEGVKNAIRFVADITSADDRVVLRDGVSCGGGNHTLTFYAKSNTSDTYTMKMHFDGSGKKQIEVTPEWQRFEYGESANSTCNAGIECSSASGYSSSVDVSVYGFQLEPQLYSTSYIPTMGTAETRAADSCSVTGASDVIGQTEGTLFVDFNSGALDGEIQGFSVNNGTSQNRIVIFKNQNDKVEIQVRVSGVVQASILSVDLLANTQYKAALGYANNDVVLYLNGNQVGTDTSASIPACTDVCFDSDSSGGSPFYKDVKRAALFNERLSNAELAALTA